MKTKIGISAGAFAALTFLLALWGGYTVLILLVGYVFIAEKNEWLKTTVAKALVISLAFVLLDFFLGAIPNVLNCLNSMIRIFSAESTINYGKFSEIINFISNVVSIVEDVVFLLLALFALKMNTIKIGFVDKFVAKHLLSDAE
ncbi:MAG: hypothetical protein K5796_05005 [Lachnospiraceae bacterium]|nr:hypothetical protein [Lachnospiraceae bacterium]